MKQILILGAGYAGLRAAKVLAHANLDARITLVNKYPYHYHAALLHQVACGTKDAKEISFALQEVVSPRVHLIIDEVVRVDQEAQTVHFANVPPRHYDYLVNALGFEAETFGIPGVKENALTCVDIQTARQARKHIERALGNYRFSGNPDDLSFVVCGAGFTGVVFIAELLGQLPALSKRFDFPAKKVHVDCINPEPVILPDFDAQLVRWVVKYLENQGVAFHNNNRVVEMAPGLVVTDKASFRGSTLVWTGGVSGSHVIKDSGYDQKRNRVVVEDDTSVYQHPEEFVIGDVSAIPNPETGHLYPASAQIAIAEGEVAAKNIIARINGTEPVNLDFKPFGTLFPLGPHHGVALLGDDNNHRLKGQKVMLIKHHIDAQFEHAIFEDR
ncbi:NAD(P)/FAD-dependent oxidoreductase [Bifidobacterium sp. ESL0790]|uniref:NAD(P)/FAD-dependent oxidoreductase n=1 Tax=Bifidobacterium sp. ESL0790 TaxID=2983233 RepID=UPI0023FA0791|nr:NAD(P)/FAD-dependent oxidoreductase [Bifidobacterium sp. ESL0790]WEV72649.1 NAD(P)/FAD-dependent oxidoreductase [Bifidobacterium sp. ESL0790]